MDSNTLAVLTTGVPMNVLVLDDDEDLSYALRDILERHGFRVDCSNSPQQALQMVKETPYDLVLLDYVMPENDGVWFMNNARLPRSTKVLLMTGCLERRLINTMFDLGACGYLIKPFDEEELVRNLKFYLPGRISD